MTCPFLGPKQFWTCLQTVLKVSVFFLCFGHGSKDKIQPLKDIFVPTQNNLDRSKQIWIVLDLYKDKAKVVSSLTLCKCWLFCINPKKRKHFLLYFSYDGKLSGDLFSSLFKIIFSLNGLSDVVSNAIYCLPDSWLYNLRHTKRT